MDIPRVFMNLKPGAKFKGDEVNFYSLDTIAKTYIGTMPTEAKMNAEWARIQAVDIPAEYRELKKAELKDILKDRFFETPKTVDQIKTKWASFQSALDSMTDKDQIDIAFNNAVTWLNG